LNILITNDDGFKSQGMNVLADFLSVRHKVTIIAPSSNKSGISSALSLRKKIKVNRIGSNIYSVNGTPSDCVHIGINYLMDEDPDMVISGINHGANLGDDIIYSGTFAGAFEGRHLKRASIAISLVYGGFGYFETAAKVVNKMIINRKFSKIPSGTVLNINVPDIITDDIKDYLIVPHGIRSRATDLQIISDNNHLLEFRLGKSGKEKENKSMQTDFYAVNNNCVAITPVRFNFTDPYQLHSGSELRCLFD
jgi:5'-nucleotidase